MLVKAENVLGYTEAIARKFEKVKKDVRREILIKVQLKSKNIPLYGQKFLIWYPLVLVYSPW